MSVLPEPKALRLLHECDHGRIELENARRALPESALRWRPAGTIVNHMRPRLILVVAAWSLFAQQDATIRVDVQQVLVPVVVTDKKGHHVSGLHKSDFRIFEDGVQQEIAAFSSDTAG